ncbi:MAG: hypothetical protein AB2556_23500, partial [Candidatus Thiodiazotropha sp.]
MDTKAFTFNSSAKYRVGRHYDDKAVTGPLSLASQEIMVDDKGSHFFIASFPDIFAQYQNPPLTGDVAMANKAWHAWKDTPFT